MLSLLNALHAIKDLDATAAGTTSLSGAGIPVEGFDTFLFILDVGTITATGSCGQKIQGSDDDVDGNYVDLEGTLNTMLDGDDGKLLIQEVVRPQYNYIRRRVLRNTANVVINSGVALCGVHPRNEPVSRDATVSHYGFTSDISPEAGTA